jgi:hypothetical protein
VCTTHSAITTKTINNNNKMGKRLAENHDEETTKPHKIRKTQHQQQHHNNGHDEKKTEEFVLTKEIADSTILIDLFLKSWRIGKPIGEFTTNNKFEKSPLRWSDCETK